MTEPDPLAALDFEPSMCWVRSCIEDAVTVARPGCNCWTWPLCAKHDDWLRGLLTAPNTHAYCRTCHRMSPVRLEDL